MELIIQTPGPKIPYMILEKNDRFQFSLVLFIDIQISYLS